jgi:quercetin dioxygenase-like cupin family protein
MIRKIVVAVSLVALVGLAAPAPGQHEGAGHEAAGHQMVMPDQIVYAAVPSLPAGALAATVSGDVTKEGHFTMRVKLPPDFVVPLHTHPGTERVTVLEGTFHLGVGETFDRAAALALPAGGHAVMEAGVPMFAWAGEAGAVIQVDGLGPWGIDYLDPDEDPRKKP